MNRRRFMLLAGVAVAQDAIRMELPEAFSTEQADANLGTEWSAPDAKTDIQFEEAPSMAAR